MITVAGEALIDLVPGQSPGSYVARPGGSPFNVAVGLARLGQPTALMARLGDTAFGRLLREHATREGVDVSAAPRAAQQTTLAVVSLDAGGAATYDFYLDGTADWQWTPEEIAAVPAATSALHFGSLAAWTPPGDELLIDLAARLRGQDVLVSYDPNVRPGLLGDPERGRALIERAVPVAHLVKASAEDVAWLYPGARPDEVSARWLDLGAAVVVLTDGAAGSTAFAAGEAVHRPARTVRVADTVGAGDAFTAGLLAAVARAGHADRLAAGHLEPDELGALLDFAGAVAAITCERRGADPPRLAEVQDAMVRRPAGSA